MYDFSVSDCTQEQNGIHNLLPLFEKANGRLCQERVLRPRNLATIVTWRHTSLHFSRGLRPGSEVGSEHVIEWQYLSLRDQEQIEIFSQSKSCGLLAP